MASLQMQLPDKRCTVAKLPTPPRPVIVIGSGGIVCTAHLPGYANARIRVIGVADPVMERAEAVVTEFGVGRAWAAVSQAVRFAPADVVHDIAIPV
jgi:predicted dehydrogenase